MSATPALSRSSAGGTIPGPLQVARSRRGAAGTSRVGLVGLTILVLVAELLGGCSSAPRAPLPPAEVLARAEDHLARGKYRDAEAGFREFLDRYPGDPAADQAQMGLALTLLGLKDWVAARDELGTLLGKYPDSPLVEAARYNLGVAYARESLPAEMDQELTHQAVDEFEAYLSDFPRGEHREAAEQERAQLREKLAQKQCRNGTLYLKMGFPEAAQIYFQDALDQYEDTSWLAEAAFGLAESLRMQGRAAEAEEQYRRVPGIRGGERFKEECERRLREMASTAERK